MDPAVWGFVGVIVGGLITGLVTIWAEKIRADKVAALDSAKRQDDRRLSRDNFQRETLLALQDAIGDVNAMMVRYRVRLEGHAPAADTPALYQAATGNVITLRSRIGDEQIREAAGAFIQAAGQMTGARDGSTSDDALGRAAGHARRVLDRSGELIQATFAEPSSEKQGD